MRHQHYILDGRKIVAVDWLTWAEWFEKSHGEKQRIVNQTLFANCLPWISRDVEREQESEERKKRLGFHSYNTNVVDLRFRVEKIMVSTVFLGLDHSYSEEGPPILFETMVFNGPLHDEMERYATYDEAEAGHAIMIERVRVELEKQLMGAMEAGK
jgi:hypothetical protein